MDIHYQIINERIDEKIVLKINICRTKYDRNNNRLV